MSRQSTSRLFGEWGIKLKANIRTWGKYGLLTLLALCIAGGVFLIANASLDGVLGSWFESVFIQHVEDTYTRLDGTLHSLHGEFIRWDALKSFLAILAVAAVLLWAISIIVTIALCEKNATKRAARECSSLIRDIFFQTDNTTLVVPREYAEAAACANELKLQMRQKEQALQQEAAQKNDLIAYLAHDLKTPLTSVVGYLTLLEEAPEMPATQRAKYVHISLDKALRLEKLINEFFEITRYNLHEILLEPESIDLSYMLTQMADEFYPLLKEHGNTVSLAAPEGLTIVADPVKLARVFNNILKNAIAYSYPNTGIAIQAARKDNTLQIAFQNSGRTIPKQKLESIFDKFYRLDDARSSNTGGAGLGLAIAREIVTAHGGTITAESENQQTTFTVTLPE